MSHTSFNQIQMQVIRWSEARKIIPNSTPEAQMLKMVSEVGELADAINKGNMDDIQDAVGDTLVCLINVCALLDIDPVDCLQVSYDAIQHRKGTLLPNGVFVKE